MPHLPKPWGRAAGALEQLVIDEELRAASIQVPGLAIGAWVAPALIQYGTAEQQQRFLPATLRRDYLWCQLFSEPGAGSDLASLTTRAVRGGTGRRVGGGSPGRRSGPHWPARRVGHLHRPHRPGAPRHDGISYFLVDMHSPGVNVRPLREITGDSMFNQVFLDDVFVPDERLVGRSTRAGGSPGRRWPTSGSRSRVMDGRHRERRAAPGRCAAADGPDRLARAGGPGLPEAGDRPAERAGGAEAAVGDRARRDRQRAQAAQHALRAAGRGGCWRALTGADGAIAGTASRTAVLGAVLFTRAYTIGGGTTDMQLNIIAERILGLPRDPAPGT